LSSIALTPIGLFKQLNLCEKAWLPSSREESAQEIRDIVRCRSLLLQSDKIEVKYLHGDLLLDTLVLNSNLRNISKPLVLLRVVIMIRSNLPS
jgi:hypothetical protein